MSDFSTIRTKLTDILTDTMGDLVTVYKGYRLKPVYPCLMVGWPTTIAHYDALSTTSEYRIPIVVEVAMRDEASADEQMERFIERTGSWSVVAAVAAEPTLRSSCDTAQIIEWSEIGYGTDLGGEIPILRATATLQVWT